MLRQIIFISTFILLNSLSSLTYSAACSTNSNGEITTSTECTANAVARRLMIYELGICTGTTSSLSAAHPTSSRTFNPYGNGCSRIFRNTDGVIVDFTSTLSTPLTGNYYRPPDGTYNSLYMILSAERGGIKANFDFSSTRNIDDTASSYNSSASGTKCWTENGTHYNWSASSWDISQSDVNCGSSLSTDYGFAETKQNSLTSNAALFSQTISTQNGDVNLFLLKSDNTLATLASADSMGNVSKLGVIAPKSSITVREEHNTMSIGFKVLDGTNIDQKVDSSTGDIYVYGLNGNGGISTQISLGSDGAYIVPF